jgi:Cdc6-like AAA superfamily ATPase
MVLLEPRIKANSLLRHWVNAETGVISSIVNQVRATTAEEAFFTLDPFPFENTIVQPNDPWYCNLESYFNAREYSIIPKLTHLFNAPVSTSPDFIHVAIVGHNGTGKTTQVRTAMLELQNKGIVQAHVNALALLDESDFTFADVILTIAQAVVQTLEQQNVDIPKSQFKLVKAWFSEKMLSTMSSTKLEGEIATEAESKTGIPFLATFLGRITATLKSNNETRTEIRERTLSNIGELVRNLNILLDAANDSLTKKHKSSRVLAIVFDNLEKVKNQDLIDKAVILQSDNLRALRCHLVLFLDPAAEYAPISKQVSQAFKMILSPNLHIRNQDEPIDTVHGNAQQAVHDLLDKRMDLQNIFDTPDDCVLEITRMSGGRLRDVLALARRACEYISGKKVTLDDVKYAAESLKSERVVLIEEHHWVRLAQIHKIKTINPKDGYLLLHSLVLNYNGKQWFDIHPLLALDARIQAK